MNTKIIADSTGVYSFKEVRNMNKIKTFLFFALVTAVLCFTPCILHRCYAAFEDLGCGARPLGMGNAFCAVANDANAFLYNPAGLAQLERIQISTMYANLFPGLSDGSGISNNFIAIAYPIPDAVGESWYSKNGLGTLGFGWFNLGVNSDPQRSGASYKEDTYIFSYAKTLEMFSFGISVKILAKEYGESYWTSLNPVFDKARNAYGVGIDFGLMYKSPDNKLALGLQVSDFNEPNIRLSDASPVPMAIRLGVGYKIGSVFGGTIEDITTAFDFTNRDRDYKFYSGVEGWFMEKNIALRFGFGTGSNLFSSVSLGASYQLTEETYNNDFRIDYAFVYPLSGLQPTGGTHRISLTMCFGEK
jgi:hypothetical protein